MCKNLCLDPRLDDIQRKDASPGNHARKSTTEQNLRRFLGLASPLSHSRHHESGTQFVRPEVKSIADAIPQRRDHATEYNPLIPPLRRISLVMPQLDAAIGEDEIWARHFTTSVGVLTTQVARPPIAPAS